MIHLSILIETNLTFIRILLQITMSCYDQTLNLIRQNAYKPKYIIFAYFKIYLDTSPNSVYLLPPNNPRYKYESTFHHFVHL